MDPIMNSFSREQMEYIVELFNPCMDDYLYVFDLQKDCYKISKHATERFLYRGIILMMRQKHIIHLYIRKTSRAWMMNSGVL